MARHIIVGTAGVGGALAARLKAAGDETFLINRSLGHVEDLARDLDAPFALADVIDDASLRAAINQAGPAVDGLAYCVGTINLKPLTRLTADEVRRDFEVNAVGAFNAVQAALPLLKASTQANASVVLFSTVAVQQGFPGHASVAMAKGAVEGLTRALAAELAPKIRVNAIAPSLTQTPLAEPLTRNATTAQAIAAMHPLARLGTAHDVAGLAAFLLGPDAEWITGQVFGVDGGRSSLRIKG
ncbi:MAG: SDR family oxidoreductase [Alphaproteobacteria bacterium]|nr:SDR family oxidoreductase [Alphaproteobacteria bacterium]